jgi:hypothetical protein
MPVSYQNRPWMRIPTEHVINQCASLLPCAKNEMTVRNRSWPLSGEITERNKSCVLHSEITVRNIYRVLTPPGLGALSHRAPGLGVLGLGTLGHRSLGLEPSGHRSPIK